ncbi:FtsX-like permease family protein [Catellatospora paridis]|uniref:FtsX-like permease family protein n=1 Tax=Catellatospora paridis TaxID=1617086 RepID=UPI0012D41E7C|nr:FtsX-like permease family protein [Catellatospora paridis]
MRPSVLLRLALAGTRTDRLRVALTVLTAALAAAVLLVAATVLAIDAAQPQYQVLLLNHLDLRQMTSAILAVVCMPVLALAAQAGRIGAPGRARRLAALRLAGASPRQVTAITAAETGVASALGGVIGLAVYLAARVALHRQDNDRLWLPTDVLPSPGPLALIVLGLPVAAALVAAVLLRRVHESPLDVARTVEPARPKPWPLLLIAAGLAAYVGVGVGFDGSWPEPAPLFAGGIAAAAGLVFSMAWLSDRGGRLLHRLGRGPAALLAARRLQADPWTGSRTVGVLVVCAWVAGAAGALRAFAQAQLAAEGEPQSWVHEVTGNVIIVPNASDDFFNSIVKLVDMAVGGAALIAAAGVLLGLLEAVAARRRVFASLTATGVSRGVLVRAGLWQALAPVVVTLPGAVVLGAAMAWLALPSIAEGKVTMCIPADCSDAVMSERVGSIAWFADWTEVAAVSGAGLIVVALLAVAAGATLRARTDLEALRVG